MSTEVQPMPAPTVHALPDVVGTPVTAAQPNTDEAERGFGRWRGHIPALDGVRGAAIAFVMVSHLVIGVRPGGGIDKGVIELARSGWIGVDLFFVLSGFLITGILLDARDRQHYFRNFYIRRTLRIFPLYYGILTVVFIVIPFLVAGVRDQSWFTGVHEDQLWFWTYTSNVLLATEGSWAATPILGGFWSLAVEEQFYLVWPVVVLLCSPRRLRHVCAAVLVGAFMFRLAIRYGSAPNLGAYTLMPARADALAAGAWVAVALRTGIHLDDIRRYARWVLLAASLAVAVIFLRRHSFSEMRFLVQTVGYTCVALGFAAMLSLALDSPSRESVLGHVFRNRFLRVLGKYSYAMYCFNPLLLKALPRLGISVQNFPRVGGSTIPGIVAFGVIFFASTIAVSFLSWHLYEKHFLVLKDRLTK